MIYNGNYVQIKFDYNPALVTIMKMFNGRYYDKTKTWTIPLEKADELIEEFAVRKYEYVLVNKESWSVKRSK